MSTQQALGVVGFVVGSYFGYPQLGFVVGSLVGAALTPKTKIEGPKLDDLKVQVSSYGVGIARLDGTERLAPNVIWSTDKLQIATVDSQSGGGKGGGTETTSYRYFVHMRQMLCQTPVDGTEVKIIKIYVDGKLQWDASSGIPVGSALASAENPFASFVLYQGHQDQLPDPTEESFEGGAGSVPAYRGVVSVLMSAVECPGGRVPQFSFLLSTSATVDEENLVFSEVPVDGDGLDAWAVVRKQEAWHFTQVGTDAAGTSGLRVSYVGDGYSTLQRVIYDSGVHYGLAPCPVSGDGDPCALSMRRPSGGSPTSLHTIKKWNLKTGELTDLFSYFPTSGDDVLSPISAGYDAASQAWAIRGNESVGSDRGTSVTIVKGEEKITTPTIPGSEMGPVTIKDNVVYAVTLDGGFLRISRYDLDGNLIESSLGPANSGGEMSSAAVHPATDGVYVWVRHFSGVIEYRLYFVSFSLVTSTWALLTTSFDTTGAEKLGSHTTTIYADHQYGVIGPSAKQDGIHRYNVIRYNAVTMGSVRVSDIIAGECLSSGETRYDLSSIPDADSVIGYKRQNPASARANVDPLLTAFGIYIVDEDGLIKFKKYDSITSLVTIAFDELGQAEAGSDSPDSMPLSRAQEVDLPRSVTVSYVEPTNDFETASEQEVRQVTEATEDRSIELPLAMSSDQAKKAAQMVLFASWRSQNTRSCKVSRKYAWLSPGDGVTIEYPRGTFKLWRIMSMNDDGLVIELNVEPGDASIYEQTAVGATGYEQQEVAPLPAPLQAQILDIPILRDVDNSAGPYVAMDSLGPVPADGELYVGVDDANLVSRGTVSASAPIGSAETVLGGWGSDSVDEKNLFTVNLGDDIFNSCTRDVLLSGGGEYWAYGAPGRWEIGASAQGDSLGDGRYILSRHLRGLFGTERSTGSHQANDTFVLLHIAGMLRPDTGVGGVGQSLRYRAVTKGRSLNSASSQSYANTGEGLMPLSPVNLRRTNSNDFTVDRRSRLSMNFATGAVPLGEATEHYIWEFYSAGYAALLGTVATNTATVTAAQIAAIGVTPSATAYIKVRQVSDSIGPGHELQATA